MDSIKSCCLISRQGYDEACARSNIICAYNCCQDCATQILCVSEEHIYVTLRKVDEQIWRIESSICRPTGGETVSSIVEVINFSLLLVLVEVIRYISFNKP